MDLHLKNLEAGDTMADINTNIQDITAALLAAVEAANPDLVITDSSPVYDLLIRNLAPVVQEERDLVLILTNVARVAPMFGSDGYLLKEYEDMASYITERFFLNPDPGRTVIDTLYLRFSKKDSILISPGSKVMSGDLSIPVSPVSISRTSVLWKQDGTSYLHPVDLRLDSTDESVFIPATDSWITGSVSYKASDSSTMLTGARSTKVLNTVQTPKLTFEGIRNSITNRSLSNMRSVLYNVRNNSVFSPDKLLKAKVMNINDPVFIERRRVLHEDSEFVLNSVVSGNGKTYLDYGVFLNKADVTLEYLPYDHPLYSEIEPVNIINNPREQLRDIVLSGLTPDNSDGGFLYGILSWDFGEYGSESEVILTFYKSYYAPGYVPDPAEAVCSGSYKLTDLSTGDMFLRFRMQLEADNYSGVSGWCELSIDPDFFNVDDRQAVITVKKDTFSLYSINTDGLGLFSPVALGDSDLIDSIMTELEDQQPGSIVPPFTKASAALPGTKVLVRGDAENQISDVSVAAYGSAASSLVRGSLLTGDLYWRIADRDGVMHFLISADPDFRNASKLLSDTEILPGIPAGTPIVLDLNDSVYVNVSVTFKVDTGYLQESISFENYLVSQGAFLRVSNSRIIYRANTSGTAANAADGLTAVLLYYGTEQEALQQSQEAFINPSLREAGHRIIVSPYRPIVFSCYYTAEYVSPFVPDRDYSYSTDPEVMEARLEQAKSRYVELLSFMDSYFRNYTGSVSDIDFSTLSNNAFSATGMYIRKLDYALYTQRGYILRGVIDIDTYSSSRIVWSEIVDRISEEIDAVTQASSPYIPAAERESLVTDEGIYRPLLIKIPV